MPACQHDFERISAFLDGETSPEEAAAVQRQLQDCAECRAVRDAMAQLSPQVSALEPLLPADFARATASFVRTHLPPTPPRGGNFRPLDALTSASRRRLQRFGARHLAQSLLAFSLPALVLSFVHDRAHLLTFLMVAAGLLAVGVPLRHLVSEVALLGSLIRGRALEEMLSAGLTARQIVDDVAFQGMRQSLRACAPLAPVFFLSSSALPTPWRLPAQEAAVAWLPVMLCLFLSFSYLSAFHLAWSKAPLSRLAGFGLLALPLLAVPFLPWGQTAGLVVGLLAVGGILARRLSVWALENPESVQRLPGQNQRGRRNRKLRTLSDNPITRREMALLSARMRDGWRGVLLWRAQLLLAPLLWGWWAARTENSHEFVYWSGVTLFSLLLFARAVSATSLAVVREREQRTWETLLQTDVGVALFVRGWMEIAAYTVFVEGAGAVLALACYGAVNAPDLVVACTSADGWRSVILTGLVMAALSGLGALTGLALSASSRTVREAGVASLRLQLFAAFGFLLAWAALAALSLPSMRDFSAQAWQDLVLHDMPLGALVLTGCILLVWARSTLRRDLWSIELPEAPAAGERSRYPLSWLPGELAAPGTIGYLLALVALAGSPLNQELQPMQVSLMLVSLLLGWIALVRLPLATLAEMGLGRLWSLPFGALLGMVGSLSALVGVSAALLLVEMSHGSGVHATPFRPNWAFSVVLGAALGATLGFVASQARPTGPARMARLRRRLAFSAPLSLSVAALFAFYSWRMLAEPQAPPPRVQQVIRDAEERERHEQLTQSDHNGGPMLLPILKGKDRPSFNRPLAAGRPADAAARQLLTTVHQALQQPNFWIRQRAELDGPRIVYPNIRQNLVVGLTRMAESRRPAWPFYQDALRLSEGLSGHGMLDEELMSLSMQRDVLTRVLVWQTSRHPEPAENRQILAYLDAHPASSENLARAVENQLLASWRYLDRPAVERAEYFPLAVLPIPAPYLRRQQRLMAEQALPIRDGFRQGQMRVVAVDQENARVGFPGALLARELVLYSRSLSDRFPLLLTEREAVRTVAALQLQKAEQGSYPDHLDGLRWLDYTRTPDGFQLVSRGQRGRPPVVYYPWVWEAR